MTAVPTEEMVENRESPGQFKRLGWYGFDCDLISSDHVKVLPLSSLVQPVDIQVRIF